MGVYCRVHFSEKWKNSSLFSELDHFMKKNNFILTSISSNLSGYNRVPKISKGVGHCINWKYTLYSKSRKDYRK